MTKEEAMHVLGLTAGYTEEQKKSAVRRMTKKFHPDINKTQAAEIIMRKVNEANEVLSRCTSVHFTHRTLFDIVAD